METMQISQKTKERIMDNAANAILTDINTEMKRVKEKYLNNTQEFNTDLEYLFFCRTQIRAAILKNFAFNMGLEITYSQ